MSFSQQQQHQQAFEKMKFYLNQMEWIIPGNGPKECSDEKL